VQTDHWVYEGTGLRPNDSFAGEFAGDRLDNVDVQWGFGGTVVSAANLRRVDPTGADGTPDTMTVLAWADARDWQAKALALGVAGAVSGVGMISIHSRGGNSGAVFNAGTIDWPNAFVPELSGLTPTVPSRMSLNVIRRLTGTHKESAEVRRYDPYLGGVLPTSETYPIYEYVIGGQPSLRTEPFRRRPDILGTAFRAHSAALQNSVPVYRYKPVPGPVYYPQTPPRYRLSLNPSEAVNGWLSAGIAFHAFNQPLPNTVPVYRHHKATPIVLFSDDGGWIFLYSTRTVEPGWTFDNLAFYAPVL
jgi:hypothetical protein